jgi:single-strand DNA-binding protein
MARGTNLAILIGNLGNDPETKQTAGGMTVTSISLATTSVRKDRDGETQERTEWHRVKFFGKLAEIAGEYLRKGQQVFVRGTIRYSKYTDRDGVERYATDIIADEMQMIGGNGDRNNSERRSNSNGGSARKPQESAAPPARSNDFADDFADDDIPF